MRNIISYYHYFDYHFHSRTAHAALCLILGGVLDRFPKLKFCLAHGGGAFPFTIGRFNHGYICRPGIN